MKITPWLCLIPAFWFGCSTQFQPDDTSHEFVAFGTGGGFTGLETTHYLLTTGQLFRQVGTNGDLEKLARIKRSTVTQIFDSIDSFGLVSYQFEQPGNAYRFLEIHLGNMRNRIVWAEGDQTVRRECKDLDALLNQLISVK